MLACSRRHRVMSIIGLIVKLDRELVCCDQLAVVIPGVGKHAAGLRCLGCAKHRGWLAQAAVDFIKDTVSRFGAPATPIILRRQTNEEDMATDKDYGDGGLLFRNKDKNPNEPRD